MTQALAEGQKRHAQWLETWACYEAEERAKWGERQARKWESWGEKLERKHRRKWERRMLRQQRRELRREMKRQRHHHHEAHPLMGWVFAAAAAVLTGMAVLRPQMGWLIFVAFGMGSSAAGILGRARRQRPQEAQVAREAEDPRKARVDALCDKLLAELRAGLRQSVEQLGLEMDAVAEAMEEVHRVPTR